MWIIHELDWLNQGVNSTISSFLHHTGSLSDKLFQVHAFSDLAESHWKHLLMRLHHFQLVLWSICRRNLPMPSGCNGISLHHFFKRLVFRWLKLIHAVRWRVYTSFIFWGVSLGSFCISLWFSLDLIWLLSIFWRIFNCFRLRAVLVGVESHWHHKIICALVHLE